MPEVSPPGAGPQTKVGSGATVAPGVGVRMAPGPGATLSRLKAGEVRRPLAFPARSVARPVRLGPAPWDETVSSEGHDAIPAPPESEQVQSILTGLRYQPLEPFGLEGLRPTEMDGAVRSTLSSTEPKGPVASGGGGGGGRRGSTGGSGSIGGIATWTARTRKVRVPAGSGVRVADPALGPRLATSPSRPPS